ncbi:MAG: aldo/keto reductase [Chitinophagales bacterium]
MRTLQFKNGDMMPNLGLGTWKSAPGEVFNAVVEAIKVGYRHIDCAFIYENEAEIGNALQKVIKDGIVKREELWITSKLWNNAHRKDQVLPAIQHTLKDLQLDYLDLYLIHWPIAFHDGVTYPKSGSDFISLDDIPIAETWQGMETVAQQGLTRHIGVSNFSIKKIKDLLTTASIRPEVNQLELHPLLQQNDMMDYCDQENIYLTAYSPLGSMDRNPAFKAADEPNLFEHPVIVEIARAHQCSTAQVLIRWAMQRGTAVIPKSVNANRIRQNFETYQIQLSEEAMDQIAALDKHYRFLNGGIWAQPGSSYTLANLWDEG